MEPCRERYSNGAQHEHHADTCCPNDKVELEERRKWGTKYCGKCFLYHHMEECPECKLNAIQARVLLLRSKIGL